MNASDADIRWMRRALRLAARGEGRTRPNPPVGAVVVADGVSVGEGFHAGAGQRHAEIVALDACGSAARGATLYVTLEPCSTHGKTPPCTERILRSGVKRVVYALDDPDPRHAGRALGILSGAGIEVRRGVGASAARKLLAPFAKRVRTGKPYLTLKLAISLDGRLADRAGRSRWITGEKARREVQRLRQRCDGVMVGIGTVAADDPSLLSRLDREPRGFRLVVGSDREWNPDLRVFSDDYAGRTLVAVSESVGANRLGEIRARGARVWTLPDDPGDPRRVDLEALMNRLGEQGVLHVLCEGGAGLAGALIEAGLVDEYVFFVAPLLLGDRQALSAVTGMNRLLDRALRVRFRSVARKGSDLMIRAFPENSEELSEGSGDNVHRVD